MKHKLNCEISAVDPAKLNRKFCNTSVFTVDKLLFSMKKRVHNIKFRAPCSLGNSDETRIKRNEELHSIYKQS